MRGHLPLRLAASVLIPGGWGRAKRCEGVGWVVRGVPQLCRAQAQSTDQYSPVPSGPALVQPGGRAPLPLGMAAPLSTLTVTDTEVEPAVSAAAPGAGAPQHAQCSLEKSTTCARVKTMAAAAQPRPGPFAGTPVLNTVMGCECRGREGKRRIREKVRDGGGSKKGA